MNVNILTEEQAKTMATECGLVAVQLFIERYLPDFQISQKPVEQDKMFTVADLAEYWGCSIQSIRQKKLKAELPFYQHGRTILFKKSEIDALTANPLPKKRGR
jgi:excisionase family DNA binding protein